MAEAFAWDNTHAFNYPGLESHPQHDIASKQMSGFGGMINFALRGEKDNYFQFLKRLKIITHAVCLGHAESLVQYYPQEGNRPEIGVLNYPEDVVGWALLPDTTIRRAGVACPTDTFQ